MSGGSAVIVVPDRPGPLIRVAPGRDELDEVIDELLPDTDEGPGWFDLALVVVGLGLIGWAIAGAPTLVLVLGVIAAVLGCVLPARSLWRRLRSHRGIPLRPGDPAVDRLVHAYDDLVSLGGASEVAAAHSALIEVATLLSGRAITSPAEQEYVEARAAAISELCTVLRAPQIDQTLQARAEVEAVGGFNSLTRLGDLTAELRTRRAGE